MPFNDRLATIGIAFVSGAYLVSLLAYVEIWLDTGNTEEAFLHFYSNNYLTLLALAGSVFGFLRARRSASGPWHTPGGIVMLLSFGLFAWSLGSATWTYYNFKYHISKPYPSWADAGYFPQIVFSFLGILVLFKMTRRAVLGDLMKPWPLIVAAAYGVWTAMRTAHAAKMFQNKGSMLKFAFDIAYPLGSAVNTVLLFAFIFGVSLRTFTSTRRRVGASATALLVGSSLLGIGDFSFNFGTSVQDTSIFYFLHYVNGNWSDVIYLSGLLWLSIGVLIFPLDNVEGPV